MILEIYLRKIFDVNEFIRVWKMEVDGVSRI